LTKVTNILDVSTPKKVKVKSKSLSRNSSKSPSRDTTGIVIPKDWSKRHPPSQGWEDGGDLWKTQTEHQKMDYWTSWRNLQIANVKVGRKEIRNAELVIKARKNSQTPSEESYCCPQNKPSQESTMQLREKTIEVIKISSSEAEGGEEAPKETKSDEERQ